MLPATLVTLVTFVLDLSNSSPVYNMQPAFITTNIGSTNGRNIRNLPCVSRKNNGLSGVCMFAIDCLKSNGTHLGTCIDRFYFGSCCHIEPIKEIGNSIETNIILDSREPPERLHNTTAALSTSTQSSFSSSSTTLQSINKISLENKTPSMSTTEKYTSTRKVTTIKIPSTKPSSTSNKPSYTTKPFGDKIPLSSTTSVTSTTEVTTVAEKLQTFQIIDGSLLETTTPKPIQSSTTKRSTTKRPSAPVRTSTKLPNTTTKPRPAITTPSKPYQRPSKPNTSSSKPSSKPTKPNSKPTTKPTKPVKASNTTTARPNTTTTSRTTGTKRTTTKPTRRVTKPITSTTTVKPTSITQTSVRTSTTKAPTRKPPVVLTKKPLISTTTSPSTTKKLTIMPSTRPTESTSILTTSSPVLSSLSTISPVSIVTVSSPASITEGPVSKKNVSQILESETHNPATNEVVESSGLLTVGSSTTSSSTSAGSSTIITSSTSVMTASSPTPSSGTTKSPSPSPEISSTTSSTTTTKPISGGDLITWTIEDSKNHTAISVSNETVAIGNFTEDWVPITTPDGWVLLPSVTPVTTSPPSLVNETMPSLTLSTPSSVELLSTFIPLLTPFPQTPPSSEVPLTTLSPDLTSIVFQNTTPSQTTPTTTSSSEGEKMTTELPAVTETLANATSTETSASTSTLETTSTVTSTEVMTEGKPVNMSDFTDVCGRRMWPEARIVGGEKSTFGKWPWQISLRQWRTSTYLHKCGAALLNENWAITAAHCVDNVPPSDLLLRLGEHDLSTESEPYLHEERRVQIVASHPQFDPRTFEYDLALLRFYEPVQFQPNILPVCVPKTDENFVGRTAYVTGWGRLYEDGPLPSVLQEVSVPVINNTVCESMYRSAGYIEHIPHIFICAGWRRGGFDSCEGDSGGPMVIQREDKRFLLAGVISWGIGCAEPNQPGVYTRISEFREWVNQILQF